MFWVPKPFILKWPYMWVSPKREGPNTQSTMIAFNEPRCPCFPDLLHTVQTSDNTQHSNCLLTLSDEHYKIKDVQVFCFHTTTKPISQYPYPASPIHTDDSKGNSLITLQTIYIPRKHKLSFHQLFTKHQIPRAVQSLSLPQIPRILLQQQLDR